MLELSMSSTILALMWLYYYSLFHNYIDYTFKFDLFLMVEYLDFYYICKSNNK